MRRDRSSSPICRRSVSVPSVAPKAKAPEGIKLAAIRCLIPPATQHDARRSLPPAGRRGRGGAAGKCGREEENSGGRKRSGNRKEREEEKEGKEKEICTDE